jgi:glycosyltransferase involved in cell wall biosynthesis
MRILQVTTYYPPSVGGIQYYVQHLAHALSGLGHQVDVLTVDTTGLGMGFASEKGIAVQRLPEQRRIFRAVFAPALLRQFWQLDDYDVVHIHVPCPINFEVLSLIARIKGYRLVATHHGQSTQGSWFFRILLGAYILLNRAVSMRLARQMVFLTQSYADSIWLPAALRRRLTVVPTGANIERFRMPADASMAKQRLGYKPEQLLVLLVGYLGYGNDYKGVDILLEAFRAVQEAEPSAHLLIVGDGDLLPEYRHLAAALGVPADFAGSIPHDALPEYYQAADLYVLASTRGPENSPMVLFEAMASGLPVVATLLPGVRDIVIPEETGVLVRPGDADALAAGLCRMLGDPEFRARAGENARRRAESYTWTHCAERMLQVYRQVQA